ncbi:MAG: TRAP transporter small permease subunit [Frankiaceae bacterium]|nr:TRAP transporter small permease subunit [Arenimonas sp.]
MRLLIRVADAANEIAGRIAAWLSVALVLLVAGLVAARYLFDAGSIAVQEAVLWLHGALFLLALGYALKHDAHVRVDVFSQSLTARARARIECLGILFLLVPFCVFAMWISFDYVSLSWGQREGSNSAGLPGWYLVKTLIPLSALLLLLQALAQLARAWARAHPDAEP